MSEQIRKPRVKLVRLGEAFRQDGAWRQLFSDSKGRIYRRSRRRGWRETWQFVTRILDGSNG